MVRIFGSNSGKSLGEDYRGQIVYFIIVRTLSNIKTVVLYLSGALMMPHFLEGSVPLRLWYITLEEKIFIC